MSIVLIGGHERMERIYMDAGKKHGCKLKIFNKMKGDLCKRIGNPDYIIMFTDVVSHKLVHTTMAVSKKKDIPSVRLHNSSLQAFESLLAEISIKA